MHRRTTRTRKDKNLAHQMTGPRRDAIVKPLERPWLERHDPIGMRRANRELLAARKVPKNLRVEGPQTSPTCRRRFGHVRTALRRDERTSVIPHMQKALHQHAGTSSCISLPRETNMMTKRRKMGYNSDHPLGDVANMLINHTIHCNHPFPLSNPPSRMLNVIPIPLQTISRLLTDVSCVPRLKSHIAPTSQTQSSRPVRTTSKPALSMEATTRAQMKNAAVKTCSTEEVIRRLRREEERNTAFHTRPAQALL